MRICKECGSRELDKYQHICSECATVNAQLSKDIYASTEEAKRAQAKYANSEKGSIRIKAACKKWRDGNREKLAQ